jgi:limonene-1,2-epoxide hydrolase
VIQLSNDPAGPLAERYLRAVAEQDWQTVSACVASDVVRHGPFGDDVEGMDQYLSFLKRTMPSLPGYRMDIDRVNELGNQRAMVELRETIVVDSGPLETFECLVFEVNSEGLLANISIYIRQTAQ